MKVSVAQPNTVVGDLEGNFELIRAALDRAQRASADLLVLPELMIVGYPPRDLLERHQLAAMAGDKLQALQALRPRGMAIIVGSIDWPADSPQPRNVAHVLTDGGIETVVKRLLPTYDVFSEIRHFRAGQSDQKAVFDICGVRVGVLICEDQWTDARLWPDRPRYDQVPIHDLVIAGAELVVNLSASPFSAGKADTRAAFVGGDAKKHGVGIVLCNLVGGNDSLVFDGTSMVASGDVGVTGCLAAFAEDQAEFDFDPKTRRFTGNEQTRSRAEALKARWPEAHPDILLDDESLDEIEAALVLGLADYAGKIGFEKALLGLSGGIDSALVAYLGAKALGDENIAAVEMPSRYTAGLSRTIAGALIDNLGLDGRVIEIEPLQLAFLAALEPSLTGTKPDVTEENLQARTRGTLLMALSNKFGGLLLSTGNKSEMAVGYCTLYGDMNGGLSVISDLYKTQVYALCKRINARAGKEVIPHAVIERPPSAELAADQTDQDSLPPYEVLDRILLGLLEHRLEPPEIVERDGFDLDLVTRIRHMVDRSEFKRHQAAPTIRVSSKAWHGRRYPIVQRFR